MSEQLTWKQRLGNKASSAWRIGKKVAIGGAVLGGAYLGYKGMTSKEPAQPVEMGRQDISYATPSPPPGADPRASFAAPKPAPAAKPVYTGPGIPKPKPAPAKLPAAAGAVARAGGGILTGATSGMGAARTAAGELLTIAGGPSKAEVDREHARKVAAETAAHQERERREARGRKTPSAHKDWIKEKERDIAGYGEMSKWGKFKYRVAG